MGDLAKKLQHVSFNEASQMSKEVSEGHGLSAILDECQKAMKSSLQENAEKASLLGEGDEVAAAIGIHALLAQELSSRRGTDHAFDIPKMTSFEAGTGPELLYWYAKLASIIKDKPETVDFSDEELISIENEEHANLLRLLAQYPDVTLAAYQTLESGNIAAYLSTLTEQVQECLEEDESEEEGELTSAQLMLYRLTHRVVGNALKLLRITPSAT